MEKAIRFSSRFGSDVAFSWEVGKVLVVEEEPLVIRLIEITLKKSSHRMVRAQCDEEALQIVSQPEQLHLLIFEPRTRKCSKALVKLLLQKQPAMKILYVSTWPQEALALEGYFHQADVVFLPKPFRFSHLESKVHALLQA